LATIEDLKPMFGQARSTGARTYDHHQWAVWQQLLRESGLLRLALDPEGAGGGLQRRRHVQLRSTGC
jgi:hypothetical protein